MKLVCYEQGFTLKHADKVILSFSNTQPAVYVGCGQETVEMHGSN